MGNLKKSLISLIKIQTPTGQHDLTQNTIVRSKSIAHLPPVYTVMEEGIDGKCENVYDIAELPEYMLQEMAPGLIDIEKCQGKKIYQILKTRNVDKCVERSSFQLGQTGKYLCSSGNCDSMFERSSITKYIACGPTKESLEIQYILNEGEIQQSLMAYNTENMVTGTKQVLKLVKTTTSKTTLPQIKSPVTLEDLYYVYPRVGHQEILRTEERKEKLQQFPLTEKTGLSVIQIDEEILSKLSPATLKQKIIKKLTEVVTALEEVERFEQKQVSLQLLTISKVISLLDTKDIKSLYEEIKGLSLPKEKKETMEQLVLEMAVISGSSPAVMFIKELIISEKISPLRIGTIIATLPHYIQTPTVKLLDELFEIIKSPVVTRHETLKSNAELSFTTLVNRACIDPTRVIRFPVFVYGEFCSSHTSAIVTKYIPYLVSQLHSARSEVEKTAIIMALGTLGHESVIPILLPYIEGKSSVFEQRVAIFSLDGPILKNYRHILLPIYSAIVHNPTEERSVRIAAFTILIKTQPSIVQFQELASSTWFENDIEFQKFVYSTLKTLSEIKVTEQPTLKSTLYYNSMKARIVLPLIKPVPSIISSSLNYFTAEWIRDLELGYTLNTGITSSPGMKAFYGKLDYVLERLETTPIELCMHMEGVGKLIEIVNKVFGTDLENKINPEWKNLISSMNLKPTEEGPLLVGFWTKIMDDVQVQYGVGKPQIESLLTTVRDYVREPESIKQKVCGKTPINLVKLDDVSSTTILIPSEIGLPILIEVNTPTVLYTQGHIDIECSGSIPKVEVSLTNKVASAYTGSVGTLCPFTKEVITTGVSKETNINYPTKMLVSTETGKLKVVYKPTKKMESTGLVDIMSFVVKPFATIKPTVAIDLTPLESYQHTKLIKSQIKLKTIEHTLGKTVGIEMKTLVRTETNITDIKSLIDQFSLYKYSPVNTVLFSWTHGALTLSGYPSLRHHEVKFIYYPTRSSTKEIEIELGLAGLYKTKTSSFEYKPRQLQIESPKDVLQKLSVETGVSVTGKINIALKGGSPKTYLLHLTAGHGFTGMTQKWVLHLENKDRMKVCVDGKLTMPSVPLRDVRKLESEEIKASYRNIIGFGKFCEEHSIKVDISSSVSHEQKQMALRSKSSRKCEEATRELEQLRQKIEHITKETPEYIHTEKELSRATEEKIKFCRQQLNELSTLDDV